MPENQNQLNQLQNKLEALIRRQNDFLKEINNLHVEIIRLKKSETKQENKHKIPKEEKENIAVDIEIKKTSPVYQPPHQKTITHKKPSTKLPSKKTIDLEKFIGENLISKIGIAITIIGVAIGAKYSIENDLISPLTRIILGYIAGVGLLGFGIKLKEKYENYSAVLVSGAMAIFYFITFAAYSFYELIPQAFTFSLMMIFTIFTTIAALNYNKQIIAHIGLVGAYAVPFLLSNGSGKVVVLFSYMAIINIGVLAIAFKKYWKPLYYVSFGLTWLIYFSWYLSDYQTYKHFGLALTFLAIFFVIFYITFLAYKLIKKEKYQTNDILLLLTNSFIFYAIGYLILDNHETGEQLLGVFTLVNAIVHFIISAIIYKQKLTDKSVFYLVSGLVLVFITIAIPVQLDGNWVTLLWAGEAALLFWIGRTKNIPIYEKISYVLMALAFFSIVHDWMFLNNSYFGIDTETKVMPLLNITFLTSVLFIAAFGFINFMNLNKKYSSALNSEKGISKLISFLIPAIFIFVIYYAFRIEIVTYWNQLYAESYLNINVESSKYPSLSWNRDYRNFKTIWVLNYSLLFVTILSFINFKKLRSSKFGKLNIGLNTFTVIVFLIQGLYTLSELRESYLEETLTEYYQRGVFNIGIRYISFIFVALTLFVCYKYVHQKFMDLNLKKAFDLLLYITILWIASSELINWLDIAEAAESYKLGLSILWGSYSLLIIALGIWKQKQHLRIGAIALFTVTLLKLFFYDISHLNTISKTIVFVSLGILLLIISFLYNKFKNIISDESDD